MSGALPQAALRRREQSRGNRFDGGISYRVGDGRAPSAASYFRIPRARHRSCCPCRNSTDSSEGDSPHVEESPGPVNGRHLDLRSRIGWRPLRVVGAGPTAVAVPWVEAVVAVEAVRASAAVLEVEAVRAAGAVLVVG